MFDLDNTLCDRDAAFGRWLKQFAPFLDHDAIAELQRMDDHGRTDRNELCRNIASRYPALGSAPSLWKQMRDGIAENVSFDQRRLDTVSRLRENYSMAVITNGGSSNQRRKLERTGMAGLFGQNVFISAETGSAKPEVAMFEAAATSLGVRPEQCLMVGDSFDHDVRGAIAANFKACWVSNAAQLSAEDRALARTHNVVAIESVERLDGVLQ